MLKPFGERQERLDVERVKDINRAAPINKKHSQLYHRIKVLNSDQFLIKLNRTSRNTKPLGGGVICVQYIDDTKSGYPKPNSYSFDLHRNFRNVCSVKLISLEIPNSGFVFIIIVF